LLRGRMRQLATPDPNDCAGSVSCACRCPITTSGSVNVFSFAVRRSVEVARPFHLLRTWPGYSSEMMIGCRVSRGREQHDAACRLDGRLSSVFFTLGHSPAARLPGLARPRRHFGVFRCGRLAVQPRPRPAACWRPEIRAPRPSVDTLASTKASRCPASPRHIQAV
jgi:hypothetical protein